MRARELMTVLDECDALLDIHASNTKMATPFVICEDNSLELAKKLNFSIISTGWNNIEPGATDGYMLLAGKPGLCIECGSVFEIEKNLETSKDSIIKYLQYFGVVDNKTPNSDVYKRYVHVHKIVIKEKEDEEIFFSKDYKDFELLKDGENFVTIDSKKYYAEEGDCIIFPRANVEIGSEIFILGKEIKKIVTAK
jgi:succinylglutamate desuccinylase